MSTLMMYFPLKLLKACSGKMAKDLTLCGARSPALTGYLFFLVAQ